MILDIGPTHIVIAEAQDKERLVVIITTNKDITDNICDLLRTVDAPQVSIVDVSNVLRRAPVQHTLERSCPSLRELQVSAPWISPEENVIWGFSWKDPDLRSKPKPEHGAFATIPSVRLLHLSRSKF